MVELFKNDAVENVKKSALIRKEVKSYKPIVSDKDESKDELPDLDSAYETTWDPEALQKPEDKEVKEKSLEFEEGTFKIDSKWWKETTVGAHNWLGSSVYQIKVKINPTGDVMEYLEWPAQWEQLFITYDAFIREVCKAKGCSKEYAEEKYLLTVDEFRKKMSDKKEPGSNAYMDFYHNEIENTAAGYWDGNYNVCEVDTKYNPSYFWLAGGDRARLWNYTYSVMTDDRFTNGFGFSGRLLKN